MAMDFLISQSSFTDWVFDWYPANRGSGPQPAELAPGGWLGHGRCRARTCGLLGVNEMLSQLS
jgi:hypothetical protein